MRAASIALKLLGITVLQVTAFYSTALNNTDPCSCSHVSVCVSDSAWTEANDLHRH